MSTRSAKPPASGHKASIAPPRITHKARRRCTNRPRKSHGPTIRPTRPAVKPPTLPYTARGPMNMTQGTGRKAIRKASRPASGVMRPASRPAAPARWLRRAVEAMFGVRNGAPRRSIPPTAGCRLTAVFLPISHKFFLCRVLRFGTTCYGFSPAVQQVQARPCSSTFHGLYDTEHTNPPAPRCALRTRGVWGDVFCFTLSLFMASP